MNANPASDTAAPEDRPQAAVFAEPSADWWRCTQCSANHQLRYRRRNPGHCLNCGTATLAPVVPSSPTQ